ncbi:MAG: zf-TFIIB domain-containing protein [Bacteroidetes bacterium]|nr:zf-TFIIB domain-containing protein [Bacteroidota bacterium]MBS4062783.1 zf-TFIIB domain-containing protein [Bacteroidota bacterium]
MKCPNCNVNLVMTDRSGIEIDYCPDCRGVWLDRGELDKIIERSSQNIKNVQNDNYSDKQRYPTEGNFQYRKKKGLLGELFDF